MPAPRCGPFSPNAIQRSPSDLLPGPFMTARFSGTDLVCLRGERLLFAGLDFALSAGEVLLLLGPNGSGKSSLLRLMAGLLPPLSGSLAWDDRPVVQDREAHRARLGYLGHL